MIEFPGGMGPMGKASVAHTCSTAFPMMNKLSFCTNTILVL